MNATGPRPVSTSARRVAQDVHRARRRCAAPRGRSLSARSSQRLAGREHQVVEEVRGEPRLEHARGRRPAARGSRGRRTWIQPRGMSAGSAVASSVRLNQPNQFASSSSPCTRTASKPAPRAHAVEVAGDERVHVDQRLERVVARSPSLAGSGGPDAAQRAARPAPGAGRRASGPPRSGRRGATARRRRTASRRAPARARTRRTRGRGRAGGGARRGRARGRSSRPRTAARPRRRPRSRPPGRARPRCASSVSSMPGEMSVQVGRADHAVLHQVQREVAGAGADLERARERAGLVAEQLAHLPEHLLAADLAERDAPLGVVVARRHVVVAAVDVEDLVGSGGSGHGRPGV